MNATNELLPIVSVMIFGGFAILFLLVAWLERSRPFLRFGMANLLAIVSGFYDGISGAKSGIYYEISAISALLGLWFIERGASLLVGRKPSKFPAAIGLGAFAIHLLLQLWDSPFWLVHLPISVSLLVFYASSAKVALLAPTADQWIAKTTSALLGLAGLSQLLYPFHRLTFGPYALFASVFLLMSLSVSLIVLYFSVKNAKIEIAREELNGYIEDSPLGIMVVGFDKQVLKTNSAFNRIVGCSVVSLSCQGFLKFVSPASYIDFLALFVDEMGKKISKDVTFLHNDGVNVPCRVTSIRQDGGKTILFCDDVSEELFLRRNRDELQQLLFRSSHLASLGELAATMAHEVNTSLTVIRCSAELAQSKATRSDLHLERILIGTRKIGSVVHGLLALARKDEGKRAHFDLRSCIEDTLAFISLILSKNQITIETQLGELPISILASQNEISQIIANLLMNASDAMKSSVEKKITITCSEQQGVATLRIADTGCGMENEVAARAFERFFTTKASGVGTGLGLSICRTFAQRNGGTLTFCSTPGQGTEFSLSLPVNADVAKESEPAACPPGATLALPARRILVVDDDPVVTELLDEYLTSMGQVVTRATSAVRALDVLARKQFDFVFTDFLLDSGTGETILHACRARFSSEECKVIYLTGYSGTHELTADHVIKKPFRWEEILCIISPPNDLRLAPCTVDS